MAEIGVLRPDERIELLDGTLIDMGSLDEVQFDRNRDLVDYLIGALGDAARVAGQTSLYLGERNAPQPDVAILAPGEHRPPRMPSREEVLAVIEVANSSLLVDIGVKPRVYAGHAIADYLVVDLAANALLHYHEPHHLGYRICDFLSDDDTLELAAFQGMRLQANAFLACGV
jgi:Uma2 family endonuclease